MPVLLELPAQHATDSVRVQRPRSQGDLVRGVDAPVSLAVEQRVVRAGADGKHHGRRLHHVLHAVVDVYKIDFAALLREEDATATLREMLLQGLLQQADLWRNLALARHPMKQLRKAQEGLRHRHLWSNVHHEASSRVQEDALQRPRRIQLALQENLDAVVSDAEFLLLLRLDSVLHNCPLQNYDDARLLCSKASRGSPPSGAMRRLFGLRAPCEPRSLHVPDAWPLSCGSA
mmetsp:Transcript_57374/g.124135  ORF Transcript_57374/g.124135 Transcript_57374/m.124135 type:complete len:232 (+) Transcript_57374:117-812(+)